MGREDGKKQRVRITFFLTCVEISSHACRYLFVDFKTADDAVYGIAALQGYQFDSKHRFYLNRFTDIERYANLDETYHEPEPEPYTTKVCTSR